MTRIFASAVTLAAISTCGCAKDCPLQDGKTYEMLIVERYDESTTFKYQPVGIPFCGLDDFRPNDRYDLLAEVGGSETDCEANFELQGTPTGLASLEKRVADYVATTPSGCVGSWIFRITGDDPRKASTPGQLPEALVHRDFQPTSGCDIPGPCRDRFVIQLF